jgi:hypothetical protein
VSHTLDVARPEPSSRGDRPAHQGLPATGRGRIVVVVLALCLTFSAWAASLVLAPTATSKSNHRGPILVIGDSLVMQATNALESWNLPSIPIVAHGGLGSAPCDWENGYTDPLSGHYLKFSEVFQKVRPAAVVFAFTGNPGLQAKGCVDSGGRYPLSVLLATYQRSLAEMALYASDHGAQVYISATPPRNPATPPGAYRGSGGTMEYGFNGVPGLNRLYEAMAHSELGQKLHWNYDPYPAEYVSTSALTWRLNQRCLPWDSGECAKGNVQVRAGGLNAIHLDAKGAGAVLYALGLVKMPLDQMKGWSPQPPFTVAVRT